jgi:tRNA1(Val) A37 N6-methylase TrmN6
LSSVFTYNYSQPEEYKFSLDSVLAPLKVAEYLTSQELAGPGLRILDLCGGCGVMGLELDFHLRAQSEIHCVEVQETYLQHWQKNILNTQPPHSRFHFHVLNYEKLCKEPWLASFDLVVCNPPYFKLGQGKLSPSEFKNRCRFFIDSSFEDLLRSILSVLKPQGQAFVLLRPLHEHGWDLLAEAKLVLERNPSPSGRSAQAEVIADIRGTHLVRIHF